MRKTSRADTSLDPIYLAAAVPFALLALLASVYDSAGYYLAPAILCVAQFLRPTRVGWILITGAYALVAGALAYAIAHDLVNLAIGGLNGALYSIGGCVLAFILMFILHVFGAMGAGDVKLFAAIGSVIGAQLVLPTFVVVVLTGGLLALVTTLRSGVFGTTMHRVLQILVGLLPGWQMPKFSVPADRRLTIPYGAAITIGAIIATAIFHA